MLPRFLHRFFDGLFWFGCALSVFAFLVLPTRTFQLRAAWRLEPEWQSLVLFIALLLTGWAYWFRSRDGVEEAPSTVTFNLAGLSARKWSVCWLLGVSFVALRIVLSADAPLDVDENRRLAFLGGNWDVDGMLFSLRPLNHVFIQYASALSMNWFGVNKFAAQLPAFLLTAVFLGLVAFWSRFSPRREASLLLLAQLACNGLFLWYSHSTRGYLSMLLVTFPVFIAVLKIARGEREVSPFHVWFFALSFLAAFLTQFFGVLFLAFLLLSLAGWLRLKRRPILPPGYATPVSVLFGLVVFGLVAPYSLRLFETMSTNRMLARIPLNPLEVAQVFPQTLGFLSGWWGRFALALAFWLAAIRWSQDDASLKNDFLGWFLLLSMGALSVIVDAVGVGEIAPRFLIAFLPAIVFWFAEAASSIRGRFTAAVAWGSVFGLLLVAPAFQSKPMTEFLSAGLTNFEKFTLDLTRRLNAEPEACLLYSGHPDLAHWTMDFHLHRFGDRAVCRTHYLVHFGRIDLPIRGKSQWLAPPPGNWTEVARGPDLQILYRKD